MRYLTAIIFDVTRIKVPAINTKNKKKPKQKQSKKTKNTTQYNFYVTVEDKMHFTEQGGSVEEQMVIG